MSKYVDTIGGRDGIAPDGRVNQMVIATQGKTCDKFDPEEWGLSAEVAEKVFMVLSGNDCKPIYLAPSLKANCKPGQKLTLKSNFKFKGTLIVMNDQEGYDLQEGEAMFKAVRDACGQYPELDVKAIGIDLQPTGDKETLMQVRTETGEVADLARVHIWKGDGRLISLDGEKFMDLTAGMQVLVDADLNVFNAMSFNNDKPPAEPKDQPQLDDEERLAANNEQIAYVDGGCNADPRMSQINGLGPVEAAIMVLFIGAAARKRVHYTFSQALNSFLDSDTPSKKD